MRGSAIDKPWDTNCGDVATAAEFIHDLTTKWFLRLGASTVMYVRSRMVEGDRAYAIYSADGVLVSVVEDIDAATNAGVRLRNGGRHSSLKPNGG